MTTDTGIKFKVETSSKERDQQLLDFSTIDILKLEQQHNSNQDIITLPINTIINSSFKKHPMSWELIHCRILHPYGSSTKEMCCNKNLDGLPKHCTKKYTKHHMQYATQKKWRLSTRAQQLTPVTSNQKNLFTRTFHFTTSLPSVFLPP